jgi:uncharacterized protein (DUF1697 family)
VKQIAFLRAINVGGHVVKMDRLREIFESLGLANVETFIASGNVVFETRSKNAAALEKSIAKVLQAGLGYEVATFIRTDEELAAVAAYRPFLPAAVARARANCVGFLATPLDAAATKTVMAFKTPIDDFVVRGREVYWLSRVGQGESKFSNAVLEKALGRQSTFRGINTVLRMADRYCA